MNREAELHLATADGHDRHVPSDDGDILAAGHEGVYEWATTHFVDEGTRFLDVGCGTGYGSRFVAGAGGSYDGVDGSPAAIAYASERFADERARFFVADLMDAVPEELVAGTYDVVFSSEVLEHVTDPFALVELMARFVKDDGVCFVGTPNRLWSMDNMPGAGLLSRSHVMEFTPPALVALLRTAFDEVDLRYRMLPAEAIASIGLPTGRSPVVRAAAAFAREVVPEGLRRARRSMPRAGARRWVPADIEWLHAGEPGLDLGRCVGLAATCRRPRR